MPILPVNAETLGAAATRLRAGGLVAFPTETVYGLGADATNGRAVAAIFAAKGRPRFNPLIVHVAGRQAAQRLAEVSPLAAHLIAAFWPGALTLVLTHRRGSPLSDLVAAGLDSVALRAPDHAVTRALLTLSGVPIAAPSANRSGHVSPTEAAHVAADLDSDAALILDGGPTPLGLESTILDARGEAAILLRPGAVPAEAIERLLGAPLVRRGSAETQPLSPGRLASHYAPSTPLRLNATHVAAGEALLAFGLPEPETRGPKVNLSPARDLVEAASKLFASLRALDRSGASRIAVMPIPAHGLGEAINDRLDRAATPKP